MKVLYVCFPAYGHIDWGGVLPTLYNLKKMGNDIYLASGKELKKNVEKFGFNFINIYLKPFATSKTGNNPHNLLFKHLRENFFNKSDCLRAIGILNKLNNKLNFDLVLCEPHDFSGKIFGYINNLPTAYINLEKRQFPKDYKNLRNNLFNEFAETIKRKYKVDIRKESFDDKFLKISYTTSNFYMRKPMINTAFVGIESVSAIHTEQRVNKTNKLIYYSSGTLFWNQKQIDTVIESMEYFPDCKLLLSSGFDLLKIKNKLPKNILIKKSVDEEKFLSHVDVSIIQGGMGTTIKMIKFGIPTLTLPLIFGNIPHCYALKKFGCSELILPQYLTTKLLVSNLKKILNNDSYKINASKLQKKFDNLGGTKKAAKLLIDYAKNYNS